MKEETLKLSILPKQENPAISAAYEVKLNDFELGHGISSFELSMPAGGRPTFKLEGVLDEIYAPDVRVNLIDNGLLLDRKKNDSQAENSAT